MSRQHQRHALLCRPPREEGADEQDERAELNQAGEEIQRRDRLLLGRPSEGLGRNDTALVQRAALALLSGEEQTPTDQLLNQLGLTDFSVRQGDTETRETIVSLGRQLSQRWYVGYERSVNTTTGTWQLIYRIAQRFTVRAQSGADNSLDFIWQWRW